MITCFLILCPNFFLFNPIFHIFYTFWISCFWCYVVISLLFLQIWNTYFSLIRICIFCFWFYVVIKILSFFFLQIWNTYFSLIRLCFHLIRLYFSFIRFCFRWFGTTKGK